MIYYFNSAIQDRGSFKSDYPTEIIKNEPMFFNSNLDFAYDNGGPITREFIDSLPQDWKDCNPVLDSRVHMLMNNFLPCIGGYHHDDIPRNTPNGQPNYDNPEYYSEHLMGLVNGDICPTLFALGKHELPKVDGVIYKKWTAMVEEQIKKGILATETAQSGRYIQFDWQSMHTGQKAIKSGWRWFIRLSRNTDRQKTMTNEIRRQVQVYLDPTESW
jgi:hypothetical protein